MNISIFGIDLGKNVCSATGLDATGAAVLRRRTQREPLTGLAAMLSPCIAALKACCGAHHIGRLFAVHGREMRPQARALK